MHLTYRKTESEAWALVEYLHDLGFTKFIVKRSGDFWKVLYN